MLAVIVIPYYFHYTQLKLPPKHLIALVRHNLLNLRNKIPMQLIRCTKKLQKEMGLKNDALIQQEPTPTLLGSWHANLILIDRRKCVLFVNDKTLFNFLVPDVPREQIRQLDKLFRDFLQCILAEEGFDKATTDKILQDYTEIGFANTNNKSVLGSMNDLAQHYRYHIEDEGGVHSCMIPQIIHELNRMPMSAIAACYPIDALRELYGLDAKMGAATSVAHETQ
jgi:hypothetical protein